MSRGFPEEFRQELLNKTDIVDVVSRYVDLKKKGGKYWGCCPFHNEKTASFNVDVNKQFFYCFGCSKGGDAITFVKEMEHLSYVEAVEYLADKAGLTVPRISNSKFEEEKEKQRLLALFHSGTFSLCQIPLESSHSAVGEMWHSGAVLRPE